MIRDREAGSATVFVVGFAVVLLAMAGLVVDGGLAINSRQRITDDVEQAARAGALNLDEDILRSSGELVIRPNDAARDARAFLLRRGYPSAAIGVDATADQVTVRAQIEQPTALLSLIFVNSFTIRAQGSARPAVGITGEDL